MRFYEEIDEQIKKYLQLRAVTQERAPDRFSKAEIAVIEKHVKGLSDPDRGKLIQGANSMGKWNYLDVYTNSGFPVFQRNSDAIINFVHELLAGDKMYESFLRRGII